VIYSPSAKIPQKSSKTPRVSVIIDARTHPYYFRTRGLSSEYYSPKKTRRTQEEILPGRAAADQETSGQYHRTRAAYTHDDRDQHPLISFQIKKPYPLPIDESEQKARISKLINRPLAEHRNDDFENRTGDWTGLGEIIALRLLSGRLVFAHGCPVRRYRLRDWHPGAGRT
jgi:hypothetical protein